MRTVIVLSLMLAAGPALAQRPATYAMTCEAVRGLIVSRGAAVLSTSPTTYDRFVADRRFCEHDEFAEPQWLPTRDTPACPAFRCRPRSDVFFDR